MVNDGSVTWSIDLPCQSSSIWLALAIASVMYEVVTRGLTEPIDFCQQSTRYLGRVEIARKEYLIKLRRRLSAAPFVSFFGKPLNASSASLPDIQLHTLLYYLKGRNTLPIYLL